MRAFHALAALVAVSPLALLGLRGAPVQLEAGAPMGDAPVAQDLDPDPDVVHVRLKAEHVSWEVAPGHVVEGMGYNGLVPGPTIEARVGDRVIVELENALDQPTTIHWHGLRVPAAMDGTPAMMDPVLPGGSFRYEFTVPDAGTFWYHPHANEAEQMEHGLYGAFIVHDPADPRFDAERVLMLDDLKLDRQGSIEPNGGFFEIHDGREGDTALLNGRHSPTLTMAAGTTERWRVVNPSSARYIRLSVGGRPFSIIGSDGGLIEAPQRATEVLLAPSDRVDLVVGPFAEGETVAIEALPYDRGLGLSETVVYGTLEVGAARPSVAGPLPEKLREIPWMADLETPADREIHMAGRLTVRGVEFMVDGEPDALAAPVRVGDTQVWDVVNETPIHHPFHLHGYFFQVLSIDGQPTGDPSLQDSVDLPPESTVRVAWSPEGRPGSWMFHCHILEHAEAGMMAGFDVIP